MFKKGQSTLEYVIVLTTIVGLLIWFTTAKDNTLNKAIKNIFEQASILVGKAAVKN